MAENRPTGNTEKWPVRAAARVWNTLTSPVTFVVLCFLWCLDLGLGSIAAYYYDPKFWMKMDSYPFNVWLTEIAPQTYPRSLWIYILVALTFLMVVSLLLCTVNWFFRKRRRLKGIGEVLVHLGFLMIFTGFVLGSAFGHRTVVELTEGTSSIVQGFGGKLSLDKMKIVRSPGGEPVDTISDVTITLPNGRIANGRIRLNHPLMSGSVVVYPPDDYGYFIDGGIVGTPRTGAVKLTQGQAVDVGEGRRLVLEGVMQPGQVRGKLRGPGLYLVMRNEDGSTVDSGYVSLAPGMQGRAMIGGLDVVLGQIRERAIGRYKVHYDPGVRLVIFGAVILALGTLWALAGYLGILPAAARAVDPF